LNQGVIIAQKRRCGPGPYRALSMQRAHVAQADKRAGNLRAVHLLLRQMKMDRAVRAFGLGLEGAQTLSEGIGL
jgi:hypothetical protein